MWVLCIQIMQTAGYIIVGGGGGGIITLAISASHLPKDGLTKDRLWQRVTYYFSAYYSF